MSNFPPTPDARVARIAEAQHGVVHLRDLRAAGLGDGAILSRARAGRLHRVHRGVYAVGHRRLSQDGRWSAAVLALGDGAALSHVSAAALWQLRPSSSHLIHVTVPTSAGRPSRPGIVVHRSRTLSDVEVIRHHAIAVTSVARTMLDLAAMIAVGPLERAVEQSLALRLFDLPALDAVIAANATRPGAAALAQIVREIHDEPPLTRSVLEALMLELCVRHGIERPGVNVRIEGYEVDFLWRRARLIVETDGHRHHGTRTAFERDRDRDAHLTMLDYRVVRVTYRQVTRRPDAVARTIKVILDRASGKA